MSNHVTFYCVQFIFLDLELCFSMATLLTPNRLKLQKSGDTNRSSQRIASLSGVIISSTRTWTPFTSCNLVIIIITTWRGMHFEGHCGTERVYLILCPSALRAKRAISDNIFESYRPTQLVYPTNERFCFGFFWTSLLSWAKQKLTK